MNIVYQEQHDIIEEYRDDFGIINLCHNLNNISDPLEGNKIDNIFKVYMQDSGLFVSMLDRDCASKILSGELGCYKGAIFDNIITVPYYMTFLL